MRWAKTETVALWLCLRHPQTPRVARLIIVLVVAYALSPVDLIPDFIPVLGLLDDALLLPLGMLLAARLVPDEVMDSCRAQASSSERPPRSRLGAVLVVLTWLVLLAVLGSWAWPWWSARLR